MKKNVLILFFMAIVLVLAACASNGGNSNSTPAPVSTPAATPAATPEAVEETPATTPAPVATEEVEGEIAYNVVLVDSGEEPLKVLSAVRNETNRNLTESKELIDNIPSVIAEQLTIEAAEALKATIEAEGGSLEIQTVALIAEANTGISVVLTDSGEKALEVVKAIRDITGKGLADSKEVVDTIPSVVLDNITLEVAEEIKAALEAAGATVEINQK